MRCAACCCRRCRARPCTSVQIDGVLHEFSSIPGVREDVTDIVLNIKDIAIKMQGDGPKRMVVKKQGPGDVTAGDIQTVGDIVVLNPELVHLPSRRGRRDPHGVHGQHRQGLCAVRAQSSRGRADRAHPGRQPVFAGAQGLLQGREHPRRPDPRLRQADDDDRDQWRGHAGGLARLRGAHPPGPAQRLRQLRGAPQGERGREHPGARRSTRRSSRRSTSSSCRCAPPTA